MDSQTLISTISPSEEQRAIIESASHDLIIQANAGAAKTTTLAFKAKHLLSRSPNHSRILFLVFTKTAQEAANDALHRVGISSALMRKIDVLTFDEFSQKVLHSIEGKFVPYKPVAYKSTAESVAPYVRVAMTELSLQGDSGFIERFLKTSRRLKGGMDIDRAKWNEDFNLQRFSENQGIEEDIIRLYLRYEKLRYDRDSDGFDRAIFRSDFDATYDLACLLADTENRTPIREISGWPTHLSVLLVDEMHDLNQAMFVIVKELLETTSTQFCGVGDRDQVIFSNHGAQNHFMSLQADYGRRKMISLPLTASRRFGSDLAQLASGLANYKKYDALASLSTSVSVKHYSDTNDVRCNQLLLAQVKGWRQININDVSGTAILLRHSWQSVELENLLIQADIYYEIRGFSSYLKQPEILLVRALHALATRTDISLGNSHLRTLMVESLAFFFGIDLPHDISEAESFDERLHIATQHAIKDGNMRLFVEKVLLVQCSPVIKRRVENALAVINQSYLTKNDLQKVFDSLEIDDWMEEIYIEKQRKNDALRYFFALKEVVLKYKSFDEYFLQLSDYENRRENISISDNTRASLIANLKKRTLTIALASDVKGLEFDNVLIPYLNDDIFPFGYARSHEEEANLLYVAATRAKKNLTLLVCKDRPNRLLPSELTQRFEHGQ